MTKSDETCVTRFWAVRGGLMVATAGVWIVAVWLGASVLDPASSAVAAGEAGAWGTIRGRVVWGGDSVPVPAVLVQKGDNATAKDDKGHCAAHEVKSEDLLVDAKTKGISSAFVFLVRPPAVHPELAKAPGGEVVLDQRGCHFVPHVLAIHASQKLKVRSSDPIQHNTRTTPFRNEAINFVLAPNDPGRVVPLVAEPRPIPVRCDLHPYMSAWLMVFDHPYFAVTAADGSFELKHVPAGGLTMNVWQEKQGYFKDLKRAVNPKYPSQGFRVEVKAGVVTELGELLMGP